MAFTPGTRFGAYEVLAKLGEGGMGEVYRARDTKLNRDVAIKILPHAFASDADRVARFTREAQTLASLNHPLEPSFEATDAPTPLFAARWSALNNPRWRYDVSPDGQRFFMPVPAAETGTTPITIVLNWTAALPR